MTISNNIKHTSGYIKRVTGSYLAPELSSLKIIVCPVQTSRIQTSNIFNTISRRWISVDSKMKEWFVGQRKFDLGNIQDVVVQSDTWVVLTVVYDADGKFNLDALKASLLKIVNLAVENKGSVHISHEILDLDSEVLNIFKETITDSGINLTIYTPR